MNLPPDRPDDTIDAHLRAALRHAPDQHERAPALISARILAAARQAAPPARARLGWLPRWLAAPWAGAGSLAAVLLVSGVLWVQRDALPPAVAPSEVASEAAAPTQAAPATAAAPLAQTRPPATQAAETLVSRSASPQPVAPSTTRPVTPPDARSDGRAERLASPAPAAEPESVRQQFSPSAVADQAAARSEQRLPERRAMAAPARAAPSSAPSSAPSVAHALAGATPAAPAAATPIAADSASGWSAAAPGAVPRPLPAGWLQALAAATPVWTEASPADAALAEARAVSLWREGEAVVWLQLARDRVQWCSAATGCWRAAISAESSSALSDALAP
jgi:hypothetical protein